MALLPTQSQTVGPYFHIGTDDGFIGSRLVEPDHPDAVRLFGIVLDGQGVPVNDSMLELWQANAAGRYAHPEDVREDLPLEEGFDGFGRACTDGDGRYEFVTVKPGVVPGPNGQPQAPHIDVSVFARGLLKRLVTRIYFPDEAEANEADPLLSSIEDPEARASLVAVEEDGGLRFDIILQGDRETTYLPFDALFVPPDVREATGERAWLQAMLDFEVALARAQARLGLVPESLAEEIAATSIEGLVAGGRDAANPVGSLLEALPGGAHRGATSQDVMDTAATLVVRRTLPLIEVELAGVAAACVELASEHRHTPMAARTFLQQALPTTFGLKAAGWLTAVDEARLLLAEVPLEVELGGAAGTLASLGDNGLRVLSQLAEELDLDEPVLPWHTRRLRIGQLGAALALAAGAVEKIALDVKLMAQTEVGELSESSAAGRGGSSTLPHKRNAVGSAVAIACAHGVRGAAFVLISVQAQEHERAGGAWQAEWEALSRALALTGGAAAALREALDGLDVHPDRMLANLEITDGLLMAEAISTALADRAGRSEAKALVSEVARRAWEGGRPLRDELIADSQIELSEEEIDRALDPAAYLGSADAFIDRALEAHRRRGNGG